MTLIKRYPNRKLYDTDAKRYISLEDIAQLIWDGNNVRVVDHASGEDVTSRVLMQVILAQEKKRGGFLPQTVLAGLIQAGGDTLGALRRGLSVPLDLFQQIDEEIEQRVQELMDLGELAEEDGLRLRDQLTIRHRRPRVGVWLSGGALERALTAYGVPTRADLRALADRLDRLADKLDDWSRGEGVN